MKNMGRFLGFLFVLMLGWFIYSQLFGTADEKAQGKKLAGKAKDLGGEIVSIFKHEINREQQNKTYSNALSKMSEAIQSLSQADADKNFKSKIEALEAKRSELQKRLDAAEKAKQAGQEATEGIDQEEMTKLAKEIESLASEIEQKQE